ncbi:MAG: GerMN domain-containing protein [bacterium]
MKKIIYIISVIILALIIGAGFLVSQKEQKEQTHAPCLITGCSSEICSDQKIVSTCIYAEEFACYQNAICERQANKNCGWTMTEELKQCLEGAKQETTEIKIYLLKPDNQDCSSVQEITKIIPKTEAVATATINKLLEQVEDTAIPAGTKLLSLQIKDSIAIAEFSKELQNYGGGSCRVAAIRAQIENTLKQFPTVNQVIISIEGMSPEEVLQP